MKHLHSFALSLCLTATMLPCSSRCDEADRSSASDGHQVPAQTTFWSVVKKVERPANAPRYSDVVFSIRWNRERCNLSHARDFHATRIEWSYINDYDWVREVKAKGYFLGGALNTSLPDQVATPDLEPTYLLGRIQSQDGSEQGPDHLIAFGQKVGGSNSPQYRKLFIDRAVALAEAGADAIHVDGPSGAWGDVVAGRPVCFCVQCRNLAEKREQDISEQTTRSLIQRYGLSRMYEEAMERTRQINPQIVWTKNVFKPQWYESAFDYEFAELDPHDGIDPASFIALRKRSEAPSRFQIYTLRSDNILTNQQTVALAHATGSLISAPYDVYPADGHLSKKRFYGRYFHFSPLYGLVRACSQLIDGYEDAFYDIGSEADLRWSGKPVECIGKQEGDVALFVRAQPNRPEGGLVIHLLDRSPSGKLESARLRILRTDLSPISADETAPRVDWFQAADFNQETHDRVDWFQAADFNQETHDRVIETVDEIASRTGSRSSPEIHQVYEKLIHHEELKSVAVGEYWEIDVPPFSIHSILHVSAP